MSRLSVIVTPIGMHDFDASITSVDSLIFLLQRKHNLQCLTLLAVRQVGQLICKDLATAIAKGHSLEDTAQLK